MCMDKRQIKSQEAIIRGMRSLLAKEDYHSITVNEILEVSGVSRSAFYSNFSDKEAVLRALCGDIFSHVFEATHEKEAGHDFSRSSIFDYKRTMSHLFYHFYEDKELFKKILSSSASSIFIDELKKRINPLMEAIVKGKVIYREGIPEMLLTLQIDSGFVALLEHWINGGCRYSPEEITEVYFKLYS